MLKLQAVTSPTNIKIENLLVPCILWLYVTERKSSACSRVAEFVCASNYAGGFHAMNGLLLLEYPWAGSILEMLWVWC